MTTFTAMWLAYLGFAAIGFYCYCCIPTGLSKSGYGQAIFRALGLTLLFTPVPIDETALTLAPAFVTLPFTLVQTGVESVNYMLPWLSSCFLVSLIITILTRFLFKPIDLVSDSKELNASESGAGLVVDGGFDPQSGTHFNEPQTPQPKKNKRAAKERLDPTF